MARTQELFETDVLDFLEVGYYRISKLIAPNVLEIEDTWFIKLKGVGENTPKEELEKWLSKDDFIKVIPRSLREDARIISDVWLGNIHINRQFSNYDSHHE